MPLALSLPLRWLFSGNAGATNCTILVLKSVTVDFCHNSLYVLVRSEPFTGAPVTLLALDDEYAGELFSKKAVYLQTVLVHQH